MTQRLLGRDVLGGAHHHAGLGHRRGVDGLGDAEVGDLHLAGRGDQDVARLDVAVHQAGGVRDLQRAAGLLEHVQRVPQRQPAGALEHRVQRLAVDQLHHQVGGAALAVHVGLAVVVDAGDARVVEHRGGARLGAEPLDELGVRGELGLEHLDRDAAAQPAVDGLPHLAHAAGGDQPLQPVAAGQRHTNARAHGPSLQRGGDRRPARSARRARRRSRTGRSPPFSTSTATATLGPARARTRCTTRAAGCCADRCRARRYRSWMRSARRGWPPSAVSTFSAPTISSVSLAATCGDTARRCSCGAVVLMLARSGPLRLSTRYGCIVTPSLAMVAATSAFCSGVSATSFWPMLDMPSAARVRDRADGRLGDLQRDRRRAGCPGRTRCAVLRSASAPVRDAELDERGVAGLGERLAQRRGRTAAARRAAVVLQRGGAVGQRNGRRRGRAARSSVAPVCSAAAVVITLNVDPGG